MPFIDSKITVAVSQEKKDVLKEEVDEFQKEGME